MKLKEEVIIAPANGETVLVDASGSFKGMIKLNDSAAFIAKLFEEDITIEEAVKKLMAEYEIDEDTAKKAIEGFIEKIKEVGLFA